MIIKDQTNFASGTLFIVVGLGVAVMASSYDLGSPRQMGPGFFPFWLGVILTFLGIILAIRSLGRGDVEDRLERWSLPALAIVLASVLLFGILLSRLGLLAALVGLIVVSSWASHEFQWRSTLLNIVILVAVCFAIFIYGLGIPLPLWPK